MTRMVSGSSLHIAAAAALTLGGCTALAGCERSSAGAEASREEHVQQPAEHPPTPRVVALDGSAVQWLIEMDRPPVLRIPAPGDAPTTWDAIPELRFTHAGGVDREQVLAANPDLIVVSPVTARFAQGLDTLTGAELLNIEVKSLTDAQAAARMLSEAIGFEDTDLAGDLTAAPDRPPLAPADKPMRVLALFGGPSSFFVIRRETYLGDLLGTMNVRLVGGDGPEHTIYTDLIPLDLESALRSQPDAILVLGHALPDGVQPSLGDHAAWSQLDAVQAGRVAGIEDFLFVLAPGTRVDEAARMLRAALTFDEPADPR